MLKKIIPIIPIGLSMFVVALVLGCAVFVKPDVIVPVQPLAVNNDVTPTIPAEKEDTIIPEEEIITSKEKLPKEVALYEELPEPEGELLQESSELKLNIPLKIVYLEENNKEIIIKKKDINKNSEEIILKIEDNFGNILNNYHYLHSQSTPIKMALNGNMVFLIESDTMYGPLLQSLWTWDGYSKREILKVDKDAPEIIYSYLISPDGEKIIWNTYNSQEERGMEKGYQHRIYLANIGGSDKQVLLSENLVYPEDSYYIDRQKLIFWSRIDQSKIYFQNYRKTDLHSYQEDLYYFNINNKISNKIVSTKEILDISSNDKYICYKFPERACCGGINYSNDITEILNLDNNSVVRIFDEYKKYNNEDKKLTEEHYPGNIFFSPDNSKIMQTIFNVYRLSENGGIGHIQENNPYIIISDIDGTNKIEIGKSIALEWITDQFIIIKKDVEFIYTESYCDTEEDKGLFIVDLNKKIAKQITGDRVRFIGIVEN